MGSRDKTSWPLVIRTLTMTRFGTIFSSLIIAALLFPAHVDGNVYITEFLAVSTVEVLDDDEDPSDFIELYNDGDSSVDLSGYFLSDDCDDPFQWSIPKGVSLDPGAFLVVWASGKNRTNPCCDLHTNFQLSGDGECLVLSDNRREPLQFFGAAYPNQQLGYTYGLAMASHSEVLVGPSSDCRATIPSAADPIVGTTWTAIDYDDESWTAGRTGVGYDTASDYDGAIELDVETAMRFENSTCYVRVPFQIDDPALVSTLEIDMQYDDGFVCYINGQRVARRNAPGVVTSTSRASGAQIDESALDFERIAFDLGTPVLVAGKNVLAIHGLNETIGSTDFLISPRLQGHGTTGNLDPEIQHYFPRPTPGSPNVPGEPDVSARPEFSEPSGAYRPGLSISLTLPEGAPEGEIRYTLDESVPTETSPLYDGPIDVDDEVVIAARVFEPGLLPSKPVFRHYLELGADVIDFASTVPIVVCSTLGRRIPDNCGHGSYTTGRFLLVKPGEDGRAQLTDAVELDHFVGYRKRGNPDFSCGRDKFFFNVEFRDREGKDDNEAFLDFASHSDYSMWGPHEFDRSFMRNPIAHWMSREVGRWSPRTEFVECFLRDAGNGAPDDGPLTMANYWGVYVLMERNERGAGRIDVERLGPEHSSEPEITGGYIIKRDRIEHDDVGLTAGGHDNLVFSYPRFPTDAQKTYIRNYINSTIATFNPNIGSQDDTDRFDVTSFIDHHILNWYPKNADAFRLSAYVFKSRDGLLESGGLWDFDRSMGCAIDPRPVRPEGYHCEPVWDGGSRYFEYPGPAAGRDGGVLGSWYGRLFDNKPPTGESPWDRAYRARWRELRRGPLSTQNIHDQIDAWFAVLEEPAQRNFARWPAVAPRFGSFRGEVEHLKDWLATRADWIDGEFGRTIEPPEFGHPGGLVDPGFELEITTEFGSIYYTLNGPDPRTSDGQRAPEAIAYTGPFAITENTRVRARVRADGQWSDLAETGFVTETFSLVVTEIMYNPTTTPHDSFGKSLYEYLELHNPGDRAISLEGVVLEDPFFDFTSSPVDSLDAGEYLVLARNLDAFEERYGSDGILIGGQFSGGLSNTTQQIVLRGPAGDALLDFFYRSEWEPSTNGDGYSLVIRDPNAETSTWGDRASWRASEERLGSPGQPDGKIDTEGLWHPGDQDGGGALDLSDAVSLLTHLFLQPNASPPCETAEAMEIVRDVDGSGNVDLSDALRILLFLFQGGPPPAAGVDCVPIPDCPDACAG